jgi:ankyrin repeat protein
MRNDLIKKPIPEYIIYDWEKIHLACESGDLEWLKKLINEGVDKNSKNDEGYTPIISAIMEEEIEIIDYLLEQNVAIDGEALIKAIYTKNQKIIEKLIDAGADTNYVSKEGWNILIHLIVNGDFKTFYWFLKKYPCEINYSDKQGLTPIFHSSGLGYYEMSEALINLGSDLSKRTNDGLSLLDWCEEMIDNPNVDKIMEMIKNSTLPHESFRVVL